MSRCFIQYSILCVTLAVSTGVGAQDNPYTYVKMSLMVPWTLYFVFLAAIMIPFVILIILAWQRQPEDEDDELNE